MNTLLVYHGRNGAGKKGTTVSLLLEAIPGGFGELYPALDIIKRMSLEKTFLDSLKNVMAFIKNDLKLWPGNYSVRWMLTADNRKISLDNKFIAGESMGAAFAMGILSLFARITPDTLPDIRNFPLKKELQELDLKLIAVTAAVNEKGELGKVDNIWQKVPEAARVKFGFVILSTGQNIPQTPGVCLIRAGNLFDALKILYTESRPEKTDDKGGTIL